MSTSRDKQDRARPRLEVLPGGRTDHDGGGADWPQFCQRIGWQQLTEPVLADDYEERLVARLFAPADRQLVSLEAERRRRRGAPSLSLATEARHLDGGGERRGAGRSDLGWQLTAVAVVALLVAGAALLVWRGGEAPPAANTVPTPAPERVPSPVAPEDEVQEPRPEPGPATPDPGMRRAQRPPERATPPLRARRADRHVMAPHRPVAAARPAADVAVTRRLADYRISPEREPSARSLVTVTVPTHLWLPVEAAHRPTFHLAAQPPAERAPAWRHLAMAEARSGSQAMALVDVLELDRRLIEAL